MTDTDDDAAATRRVDALYALPPEEFTAARDDLARTLRSGGERATAAAVKKLRRPTVVAWTLNQLVRRHREEVDALLGAGDELRQAQRKALSGLGATPMREAQQRRRASLDGLTERTAGLLRERGAVTDAQLTAVRRALEAASVDSDAAAALLEARLSQPPEAATGFDAVAGLTIVPDAGAGEAVSGPEPGAEEAEAEEARRAEAERAAARLADAERAAERAAAQARVQLEEADAAAQVATDAQAAVERLARDLKAARQHAERTSAQARRAAAAARQAAATAKRRDQERRDAARDVPR